MSKLMISILAIGMTVLSGACAKTEQAKPPVESSSKPNIVVVVADDMGWGDSARPNPASLVVLPVGTTRVSG